MTAAGEIGVILDAYGRPAPTLLPWLARWAATDRLPLVARAAAAQAALAPMRRWPAVTDAVAQVLAGRTAGQPGIAATLAELLPQIAAHLTAAQVAALIAAGPRAEVVGYAALAGGNADRIGLALRQLPGPPWPGILAAAEVSPVPPLANLRLLARLTSGRPVRPGALPGSEAAYLLPYLPAAAPDQGLQADEVLEEIEDYLPVEETSWYAAALSARVVPFLDQDQRLRLSRAASAAPPSWAGAVRRLAERPPRPWGAAADEIEAAHPAVSQLSELAGRADPAELAAACALLAEQILRDYGDPDLRRWEPAGFAPAAEPASVIIRPASPDAPGQVPLGTLDDVEQASPPVRSLVGECPETASVGRPFSLRAWIAPGAERGVALKPFDVPAAGRDVLLIAAPSDSRIRILSDPSQLVHVPRAGNSDEGEFTLQVDAPGQYSVSVLALLGGTHLGTLRVDIAVGSDTPTGPDRRVRGEVGMEPVEGAVSLIARYAQRDGVYRFLLVADDYPSEVRSALDSDPVESINGLIQTLNDLATGRRSFDPEEAAYFLANKGAELWANLIPDQLRAQFWDRRDKIGQLTIVGDGDIIPWEVLYPKDRGHADQGFLVDQFPVTRAVFDRSRARSLRLRPARFVLPSPSPTRAADEVAALGLLLGETSADAVITEYSALMRLLRNEDFGVLHFACHNAFDPASGSSIRFGKQSFTPDALTFIAKEQALADWAPIVFINACRAADSALSYTKLEGWATKFMEAGAAAFIGSLWEVTDETSTQFALEVYRQLASGSSLGASVLAARKAIAQSPGDPTWLAYTVYGDPRATVTQPAVQSAVPPTGG